MELETLKAFTASLVEKHGSPLVLDVDHSVRVHKPVLSGTSSPASYYIKPPEGLSAESLIEAFEALPGFEDCRLTLVSIMGLDTYHQPLISADDFARKHFRDNQTRIIRVVGKSDQAIQTMSDFIELLKRPFDTATFPNHKDFAVSGYRPYETGRLAEVKLLYLPAHPNELMKVERLVSVHLDECNVGREITASRHATRDHAPELILTSLSDSPTIVTYLADLAKSLPQATKEQIEQATETARRSSGITVPTSGPQTRFAQPQAPKRDLDPQRLQVEAVSSLAGLLKSAKFAGGAEVNLTHGGATLEIVFPRSAATLWLGSSFNESKHIKELSNYLVGVRSNPVLKDGWKAHYSFSGGKLQVRAVASGFQPPSGWKPVPG